MTEHDDGPPPERLWETSRGAGRTNGHRGDDVRAESSRVGTDAGPVGKCPDCRGRSGAGGFLTRENHAATCPTGRRLDEARADDVKQLAAYFGQAWVRPLRAVERVEVGIVTGRHVPRSERTRWTVLVLPLSSGGRVRKFRRDRTAVMVVADLPVPGGRR